jgi:hypothetical protein
MGRLSTQRGFLLLWHLLTPELFNSLWLMESEKLGREGAAREKIIFLN